MSTSVGHRMVQGGAVKYHSVGNGLATKIAAKLLRAVAPIATDFAASKLEGNGYKIQGQGKKKKKATKPKKKR